MKNECKKNSIIDDIKKALPMKKVAEREGIALKAHGDYYIGRCPFHNDNRASFAIYTNNDKWKCFTGCGSGDVIDFYEKHWNMKRIDVVKKLVDNLRLNVFKKTKFNKNEAVKIREHFYHDAQGNILLRKDILKDEIGNKQAFYYRRENNTYVSGLNSMARPLYRLPAILKAIADALPLCFTEGEKDADKLAGLGYNATTLGGASDRLQSHHLKDIPKGIETIVFQDNDPPGRNCAAELSEILLEHGCRVKVIALPGIDNIDIGNGRGNANKADVSDWLEHGHTADELQNVIEQTEYVNECLYNEEEWPEIIPLSAYVVPEFPIECLPDWVGHYARELSEATQTPVDMASMLSLSVIAAAIAHKVEVMPREGWYEPVNIYSVVALPPASRKSAVFSECTAPILQYEQELRQSMGAEVRTAQNEYKALEQAVQQAQSAKAKALANGREPEQDMISELSEKLEGFTLPVMPRLVADDSTLEVIASLLAEQKGRIAIMSAEGDLFDILAGRYSAGSTVNIGIVLKGHSGDFVRVDRIGRGSVSIDKPAITIGLAIQPDVLRGLIQKPGFRGRGLLGRFLYSLPASNIGSRRTDAKPLSELTRQRYYQKVKELLDLPWEKTNILVLDEFAEVKFKQFEQWIEPNLGEGGELASIPDWGGKLAGAVARIASIIHMAEHAGDSSPWEQKITPDTINRAVKIGRYLMEHAKAAFDCMGDNEDLEAAKTFLRWIERTGASEFKKRELFNSVRGSFPQVEMLSSGLSILKDYGYIKEQVFSNKTVGRPSILFDVSPKVYTQKTDQLNSFVDIADIADSNSEINLLEGEF